MRFGDFIVYEDRRGVYLGRSTRNGLMLVLDLEFGAIFSSIRDWYRADDTGRMA